MNRTQALPLLLTALVVGALAHASGQSGGSAATARISDISLRVNSKVTSLVIEVSASVPYVATRPDPVTVILEFRNTTAKPTVHSVARSVRKSIAAVSVEAAESVGGPVSRVRIALAQPLPHHVRSERNKVIVDLDKPTSGKALPTAALVAHSAAAPKGAPQSERAAPAERVGVAQMDREALAERAATPSPPSRASALQLPIFSRGQAAGSPMEPAPAVHVGAPLSVGQPPERQYSGHPVSLDFQGRGPARRAPNLCRDQRAERGHRSAGERHRRRRAP